MKISYVFSCIVLFIYTGIAQADRLAFPTTEAGIIEALSFKDGKATVNGKKYESRRGRVYEIVNGRRIRKRGMAGIVNTGVVNTAIIPKAGARILFRTNSARITGSKSFRLLDTYAQVLKGGLKSATLQVRGHTDNVGNAAYNRELSERRANAVRDYLQQQGVAAQRLHITGFGEDKPIASNATETGRAQNRRVEFARIQ